MEKVKQLVLIVEDQAINRQILRHILESEYAVLEAENGRDALAILDRNHGVGAILLDLVMPVMDGYEFLRSLKGTSLSSIPVIALTSSRDDKAEQKALDLGAWDFVPKPYQASILMSRLKNVIVRSQFYLISEMKHLYEHDPLTDLYNRTTFFSETRLLLDRYPDRKFALVRFDIDEFHLLNSFWGEEEGNRFLRFIAAGLREIGRAHV